MTNIGCPHDGWVVVGEYKINVVWGPTHHENDHNKGKHLDNFLLVIPALGHGRLGHQQSQGGLVSGPEVTSHLVNIKSILI